jgi:proteasome lid subunit RPN8/RPN11
MHTSAYRFAFDLYAPDGAALGQVPIEPDWEAAVEAARFEGMRRGTLPASTAAWPGIIEPMWHPKLDRPYLSGVRAVVRANGAVATQDIPNTYLHGLARQVSTTFVERGTVERGTVVTYLVCAYPHGADAPRAGRETGFEEIGEPLPITEAALAPRLAAATPHGELDGGDVPVFVPRAVLDQAVAMARAAGEVEAAGILIGHLYRAAGEAEWFVDVTALIAAPHTVAGTTHVQFTGETWAAARAAVALRRRNEIQLGYFHSHPNFCARCPAERQANCVFAHGPVFSTDDVHLMRVCFPRGFQIALLVSDVAQRGLVTTLYGWRRGLVQERGFHVPGV